jgi:hypothetical protein
MDSERLILDPPPPYRLERRILVERETDRIKAFRRVVALFEARQFSRYPEYVVSSITGTDPNELGTSVHVVVGLSTPPSAKLLAAFESLPQLVTP